MSTAQVTLATTTTTTKKDPATVPFSPAPFPRGNHVSIYLAKTLRTSEWAVKSKYVFRPFRGFENCSKRWGDKVTPPTRGNVAAAIDFLSFHFYAVVLLFHSSYSLLLIAPSS
jgi:hypothetical protein